MLCGEWGGFVGRSGAVGTGALRSGKKLSSLSGAQPAVWCVSVGCLHGQEFSGGSLRRNANAGLRRGRLRPADLKGRNRTTRILAFRPKGRKKVAAYRIASCKINTQDNLDSTLSASGGYKSPPRRGFRGGQICTCDGTPRGIDGRKRADLMKLESLSIRAFLRLRPADLKADNACSLLYLFSLAAAFRSPLSDRQAYQI